MRRGNYPSFTCGKPVITNTINNNDKTNDADNRGEKKEFTFSVSLSFSAVRILS